jgi:hypothetical protein
MTNSPVHDRPPGDHQPNGSAPLPDSTGCRPLPTRYPAHDIAVLSQGGGCCRRKVYSGSSASSRRQPQGPSIGALRLFDMGVARRTCKPPVPCDETGFTHSLESPGAHGGPGEASRASGSEGCDRVASKGGQIMALGNLIPWGPNPGMATGRHSAPQHLSVQEYRPEWRKGQA